MTMKLNFMLSLSVSLILVAPEALNAQKNLTPADKNWPQWRGPAETGATLVGNPPVEFSETKNIKWKTEIPGKGHATPIIRGDQIIVLTAVATDKKPAQGEVKQEAGRMGPPSSATEFIHKFQVISVDRITGKIQWERTVMEEIPLERTHNLGSWASNSPVTDGENIYAYFGSRGLHCLDFKGNVLWDRDFGQMEIVMSFGEGSSPSIYKDKIVVVWDHEAGSFICAVDKKTGKDVWKVDRDEKSSWASPLIVEINGKTQVITAATNKVRSYDFETGKLIWECSGLTRNVIPNPVYAEGILYVMSGYRGNALIAINLAKAKGNITDTDVILWKYNQDTPYTPSPVLMDGKLYFLKANNGTISCLDAKDGKVNYINEKLDGIVNIYSSPTGAGGHLYIAADGIIDVIKAGPAFALLSSNKLDDTFHASPVVIGNDLYLRGFKYLYCISAE
ncbi:MAG: PQQ-binding-like beta-propeller repeat protein [Bacteroidia bacterium]|nr:PQQ-binding-like beta-propeller repeat protein [Bacteroidia bacterium]